MFVLAPLVFLPRDGCELAEVDLMPEFGLLPIAVNGEDVRSQDDEDGLP